MMREREMRGFRVADGVVGFVVVDDGDAGARLAAVDDDAFWVPLRAVLSLAVVVAASAVAAAAREVGLTGGGMTACLGDSISSGVVNIFPDEGLTPPPPWGLFVIASSTAALRGGDLAR